MSCPAHHGDLNDNSGTDINIRPVQRRQRHETGNASILDDAGKAQVHSTSRSTSLACMEALLASSPGHSHVCNNIENVGVAWGRGYGGLSSG